MNREEKLIDAIDSLLPQTQCRLCTYAGCRPYAAAIATQGERINRCLPGGVTVLRELGALLNQSPEPYVEEMAQKAKPPLLAVIREDECIGCTKCIQACPVDAIIGASKQMHTVLADVCNGCELCIQPCPVDCIDLVPTAEPALSFKEQSRQRYLNREARLAREEQQQQRQHQSQKTPQTTATPTLAARQAAIQAAVARSRTKNKNRF